MKDVLEEYGGIVVCVLMGITILGIFLSMFQGNGTLAQNVDKILMSPLL